MELVCPAGNAASLEAAVENGADAVYIGLNDHTNARYFAGLNFSENRIARSIESARKRGVRVFLAINTFAQAGDMGRWTRAVDRGAELGVDALILADAGLLDYAAAKYPDTPRHLSVQASATHYEALRFYTEAFGIRRAVLPRVLSLQQIRQLAGRSPVELEVFGFGGLCIMAEGRCYLSSYLTGDSPNTCGACSPAHAVRWVNRGETLETRLNDVLINRYHPGEQAGYPTLCKGRFECNGSVYHALEEPVSLNTIGLLPELDAAGISAIKLEGRQRSPAYVASVVSVWRQALDAYRQAPGQYSPRQEWLDALDHVSEGRQTTFGAFHRPWR